MSRVTDPLQQPIGISVGVWLSGRGVAGPASYLAGGVSYSANYFGLGAAFKTAWTPGETVSGTYYCRVRPISRGNFKTFNLVYYVTSTNAEVANAVDLSAEYINIFVLGT
jgi:hypothetical protein